MPQFVRVASMSEVGPGRCTTVEAGKRAIALANVDGQVYAVDNICRHQGGPLGEGEIEGCTIVCPWHAWRYDLRTGESDMNPRIKIDTFPVQVTGNDIHVEVD